MIDTLAIAILGALLTVVILVCIFGGALISAKLAEEYTRADGEIVFVCLLIFGWLVLLNWAFLVV